MRKRHATLLLIVGLVTCVALAIAAVALGRAHHNKHARASDLGPTGLAGAYPFTRAAGLDSASALSVGDSAVAGAIKAVRGNGQDCLLFGSEGDHCLPEELVAQGKDVSVATECGSSENGGMSIYGSVAPSVSTVRIAWNAGPASTVNVTNGAFLYNGKVPSDTGSYPTAVSWLNDAGEVLLTKAFPLSPSQICHP